MHGADRTDQHEAAADLAKRLDGREYAHETTKEDRDFAFNNNLVIIYGASDDLCEFRGAFHEELGAIDGETFYLRKGKDFVTVEGLRRSYDKKDLWVKQIWCPQDRDVAMSWGFETNIPGAAKFRINEEDDCFGEGLVVPLP